MPAPAKGKKGKKAKAAPPPKVTTSLCCASSGNVMRSALLEGFIRSLCVANGIDNAVTVTSCALLPLHVGELPHPAAQSVARLHGIDISSHRARPMMKEELRLPLVILMDGADCEAYQKVKERFNYVQGPEVRLLNDFIPGHENEPLADPFFSAEPERAMEEVHSRFAAAAPSILGYLQQKLK